MLFPSVGVAARSAYSPAPVDKILQKQFATADAVQKYKNNIVRSYTLSPQQLQNMLESEYAEINRETERMQKIKQNWRSFSYPYRLVNYKLTAQISDEITQSRKKYAKRKKRFEKLLADTPAD